MSWRVDRCQCGSTSPWMSNDQYVCVGCGHIWVRGEVGTTTRPAFATGRGAQPDLHLSQQMQAQANAAQQQAACAQQARGIPFAQRVEIAKAIDAQNAVIERTRKDRDAWKVSAENERRLREVEQGRADHEAKRANRLSDETGAIRTELQTVKAELCDALRTIENLKRKRGL